MSTVAHTILEIGVNQEVKIPGPSRRRIIVTISASYRITDEEDAAQVSMVIEDALQSLLNYQSSSTVELDGEEPTARVEIHNIPEEPGT